MLSGELPEPAPCRPVAPRRVRFSQSPGYLGSSACLLLVRLVKQGERDTTDLVSLLVGNQPRVILAAEFGINGDQLTRDDVRRIHRLDVARQFDVAFCRDPLVVCQFKFGISLPMFSFVPSPDVYPAVI